MQAAGAFRELATNADEPEIRYGVGTTWAAYKNVTISFEYFEGKYKRGFVYDDDGNELERESLIAAQVALGF